MKEFNGLTNLEVLEAKKRGQVNTLPKPIVKSNFTIIFHHVFNLFNAYIFIIALALVMVKAYSSLFFLVVVIMNTIIRIVQEIRSKNTVKKLNLIVAPKTKVLREGELCEIDNEEIVLNDVIFLEAGNQISCDSVVLKDSVEVDESLISGEAEPIFKQADDELLSGSFLVSGACYARVIHVGNDNYATKLTNEARNRKPIHSELMATFNKVTKITGYFIVPLAFLMIFQAYVVREQSIDSTIINTSAALLGMLPKGLVLLTSVSLAASVVKLGSKKALIQELFSIEMLSRIDVLCLDKTGTLTEGVMSVQEVYEFEEGLDSIMRAYVSASTDNNATFQALNNYFKSDLNCEVIDRIPFSSARKWSALCLKDIGTIVVGAPEFILPDYKFSKEIEEKRNQGARILLVAKHDDFDELKDTLHEAKPIGAIAIADALRNDAVETIQFFKENEVQIKVISGDNPQTVSAIAKQAGVEDYNRFIDATTLVSDEDLEQAILNYNIIGRATPYQKHKMILCLQEHKKKVAMTGDGVNDVLALKDADVSIAMGSGSDAARQIAHVVIIDGCLKTLIDIVREGRLDINNITRSASMYYLKTIYTICLSILIVLLNIPYPFIPFQIMMIDMFIEGFPSFMLMFERNIEKPKESVWEHSLRFSLPNAIAIVVSVAAVKFLAPSFGLNLNQVFTVLYFTTAAISLQMIYRIYAPVNWYRAGVLIIDIIGFVLAVPIFWSFLQLSPVDKTTLTMIGIIVVVSFILVRILTRIVADYLLRHKKTS